MPRSRSLRRGFEEVAIALALPASVAACGSRTGLSATDLESPDGATVVSNGGAPPGTVLCSRNLGRVSTCLETSENGGVVACANDFPYCLRPSGYSGYVCCSGPGPINGPGGSCPGPGAACPGYRATVALDANGAGAQCLPDSVVAAGDDGLPDCVVVAASVPAGAATAAQRASCCGDPGLVPLLSSVPAWTVSPELAGFACVCRVRAVPSCPTATGETGTASWCYAPAGAADGCAGAALHVAVRPADAAAVYVACFEPL